MGEPVGQEDSQKASTPRTVRTLLTADLHEGSAQPVHEEAQSTAPHQQEQLTLPGSVVHRRGGGKSFFLRSQSSVCRSAHWTGFSTAHSTLSRFSLRELPSLAFSIFIQLVSKPLSKLTSASAVFTASWASHKHITQVLSWVLGESTCAALGCWSSLFGSHTMEDSSYEPDQG